ncbi:MAG: hypothetical protein DBY35_03500 [Bacteroidales bacterium]|nr:MAG: hypothetical protein DBY35_03500 [Bacteroidales bacterium]
MAQEYIKFNDTIIHQPDEFSESFASTSTNDSGRTQDGVAHNTFMFTVENFSFKATHMHPWESAQIMQMIVGQQRFKAHYFSPYYGAWRDDYFYVSQGSISAKTLELGAEDLTDLSFNMICINPL